MEPTQLFNFDYSSIEAQVLDLPGHYYGLSPEALYTSVEDYQSIFRSLEDAQTWVELGSGVGSGPLLFSILFPQKRAIGIEFDRARHEAAEEMKNRLGILNCELIHSDLSDCELPVGDVYFLYFPTGPVLDRILVKLAEFSHQYVVVLIESHGDLFSRVEREAWLKLVTEIPLTAPRHAPQARVLRPMGPRLPLFHDCSFQKKYFVLEDDHHRTWLGESEGMEWLGKEEFNLIYPPRTILSNQVERILEEADLDERLRLCINLRRKGELRIFTSEGMFKGEIRKIFLTPSFGVELSTGSLLEWSHILKIYHKDNLCFDCSSSRYFS